MNDLKINIQNNEIIEIEPMMQLEEKINISSQELVGEWMTDEYYRFCFFDNNEYSFECAGYGRARIWECGNNIIIIRYREQETEIYDMKRIKIIIINILIQIQNIIS
jgi:hypothetical protein